MRLSLDLPAAGSVLTGRAVRVAGWVHDAESPVATVSVLVDGALLGRAGLAWPRPDVAEVLGEPGAVLSGFDRVFSLPPAMGAAGTHSVQVLARLLDGRARLSASVPLELTRPSPVGPALPRPGTSDQPLSRPIRTVWFARSLDLGGSQLRMAEVVEHLAVIGGWETTVLTPHEGPLRDRLERAGATVRLVDAVPFDDPVAYRAAVGKLAATFRHDVDLVVGPTVTSFPAVHAAALAGVPSVLRVGEAAPLPTIVAWMGSHLDGAVEEEARRSFAAASVVWSNSYRAVEIFQEHEYAARYVVQGSGIRAPRPDLLDQRAARTRLGLPERRRIAICAATIWPMKGQGILVEAIRALRAEHPELLVVMVGIGDSSYTDLLRDYVAIHGLEDQVRIAPFQDDLTDWWRAADLLVCAAEQEALPGAVAEGMAHGLPVAATRVGDIPLILEEGRSGWLCDADDVAALVDALGRAAQATPETLRAYGRHAAAYIAREHNRAGALDRTVALLEAAAGGVFPD